MSETMPNEELVSGNRDVRRADYALKREDYEYVRPLLSCLVEERDRRHMRDFYRNIDIFTEWLDGSTQKSLGDKYGISPERVRQIIHKVIRMAVYYSKHSCATPQEKQETSMDRLFHYIRGVAAELGMEKYVGVRAANGFCRYLRFDLKVEDLDRLDLLDMLRNTDPNVFFDIRAVGWKAAKVLLEAHGRLNAEVPA